MINNERGLTVVEILVAVVIITVGLVAVATGMQLATSGIQAGQQQTTAAFLAEQRLEDIRAFAFSTAAGQGWDNVNSTNFAGSEGYGSIAGYDGYRRQTTITTPTATMKRVSVSVFFVPIAIASSNAERGVVVSTMLTARE